MNNLFILALGAAIISFAATPFVRRFAEKIGVIDIPKDNRRVHKKPIPKLGGLSLYISFVATLILKEGSLIPSEKGIILGATVIVIGGFLDDKYDIKPIYKIIFQVAATCILLYFGIRIRLITNPTSDVKQYLDITTLGIPLTILWVVGVTNAFNLIDGLDGLAAGVACISSITMLVIALLNNRSEAVVCTAVLSGSLIGFLPFNFNPASIFMSDTGSQLLGFLLAAISIEGAIKSASAFVLAVPILALGLPICDTLFAIIRRKVNGKPIMQADRGHLHHRLLDMGLNQRQAVVIMYLFSALLGIISIIVMEVTNKRAYTILTFVVILIVLIAWKCGFFVHKE
ncbi:MAG: MraY family glycosyltransferase [Bacillota bacterium]|nr:MraY family glycosyltransferase [Bacillota bacterium]